MKVWLGLACQKLAPFRAIIRAEARFPFRKIFWNTGCLKFAKFNGIQPNLLVWNGA